MTADKNKKKYAVALGFFDGLHKAHKSVLTEALGYKKEGFIPAVILFDKHPRKILLGDDVPSLLQSEKRDRILTSMGFTCLYVSFQDIMNMSPEEFVDEILVKKYGAGAVVSGYNYRFGKNGSGDSEILSELCRKKGISVTVCPEYTENGEKVSSTKIREYIRGGEIEKANSLLDFRFSFFSEVFSGDKRGRTLGTPTINQYFPHGLIVPKFGVYAVKVYFDNKEYNGVANIGCRPTFGKSTVRCETYIIDFSGDLYGKTVEIAFCQFIREEKRFASADELMAQIAKDVTAAKVYFGS